MQNIINLIESGDITNNDLLTKLIEYENEQVNDYNKLIDKNHELQQSVDDIQHTLEMQHEALLLQDENEKILRANEKDFEAANKSLTAGIKALEDKAMQAIAIAKERKTAAETAEHQLKVARKEIKAFKEQVKRNKAAMSVRDAKLAKLEKQATEHRKSAKTMGELVQIASIENEQLLMFPTRQIVNGKRQSVLLYTNGSGCYLTAHLVDGQPAFSNFINKDCNLAERTKQMIINNCMDASPRIQEISAQWLYKVNIMQNCDVKLDDMQLIKA